MTNLFRAAHRTRPKRMAGAATLILLLAGCGPGATETAPTPADDPAPTVTPTATPTADAEPDEEPTGGEEVRLSGFAFQPGELTISVGTDVEFVNEDSAPHTATHGSNGTAADDPVFDERLGSGDSATVTFDEAGTYEVTCTIHPSMNMTITVED